jgi:hypothetical protein
MGSEEEIEGGKHLTMCNFAAMSIAQLIIAPSISSMIINGYSGSAKQLSMKMACFLSSLDIKIP